MLAEPLRSFWYAMGRLCATHVRTGWGAVVTDPRFPAVWDANHANVLEDDPGLTAAEVHGALRPALRRSGAAHEHVEFWEPVQSPALDALRAGADRSGVDVDMALEGQPPGSPVGEVEVREVTQPDEGFVRWYRETRNEFGGPLPGPVVDQMVRRDLQVYLPAGLRWFVGLVDGKRAGYASLISLAGVGYLEGVVTMPPFRRRGVATATVTRAVQSSLAGGDALVHLLAERGGPAQGLYRQLGFRPWGRVESFTRRLGSGVEGIEGGEEDAVDAVDDGRTRRP